MRWDKTFFFILNQFHYILLRQMKLEIKSTGPSEENEGYKKEDDV